MAKKEEFIKRLQATFRVEAEEHLQALSAGLTELERTADGEREGILERIYREAHSLKGAARAVDATEVEETSHALESVLAGLRRGEAAPEGLTDALQRVVDGLGGLLSAPREGAAAELIAELARLEKGEGTPPAEEGLLEEAFGPAAEIEAERAEGDGRGDGPEERASAEPADPPPPPEAPAPPSVQSGEASAAGERAERGGGALAETVRIPAAKLDALLLQAEEMVSAKLAVTQREADLKEAHSRLDLWQKEWARVAPEVRSARQRGEGEGNGQGLSAAQTARLLEFLDWNEEQVKSLEGELGGLSTAAEADRRGVGGMVDQLLEEMKQVLMHPFSTFAGGFPRMVRDLARELGKEVELEIEGGEVEIDRRVLEQMKDPFVHLLRNAVDHGIESPEERERKGKPGRGRVTVALSQVSGSRVEVIVADDGAGVDLAAVKAAAVQRGLASAEEAEELDEQGTLGLAFQSDVSTSRIITDLSGRGLGLAIVREKVENLGGSVSVETGPETGTSLRILLPLTLATFRGILVEAAGQSFIIPTANVERVVRVRREDVRTVENRETIPLNGSAVSLVHLADVLELQTRVEAADEAPYRPVLVLGAGDERIGFGVEQVRSEQVVLIKSLGPQLARVRNVAGATVLGSGQVVPILNVPDLLKTAVKTSRAPAGAAAAEEMDESAGNAILVVEDSITSRTLLKNILEAARYQVQTAVDGVEGLTELRSGRYDLVVSDVQMPRMDGFELTRQIRADEKLGELPLVLVTSLESREDREQGIDAGADGYIVKSSFDQSNLLETIRRLI